MVRGETWKKKISKSGTRNLANCFANTKVKTLNPLSPTLILILTINSNKVSCDNCQTGNLRMRSEGSSASELNEFAGSGDTDGLNDG